MRTLNIITRQKHKAMWCVWFRGAMAYITLPALATLLYIHISSQHSTRTECSEDSGRVFVRQIFFSSRKYMFYFHFFAKSNESNNTKANRK